MGILSWIIVGVLAGAIAKAIYPGHQGGGILATMALGIVGALVGGFLGSNLLGIAFTGFSIQGLLVAVAGACIVIFLYQLLVSRRTV